jgi:hypothetical protein
MVNGVFYGLALSASDRAASALGAALRNFEGRQHSRRKDGGDQFAVGHFPNLRLLHQSVNIDCIPPLPRRTRVKWWQKSALGVPAG